MPGSERNSLMEHLDVVRTLVTDHCVIGGWAALRIQGNTWFDGRDSRGNLRPALIHCEPGSRIRRRPYVEPFRGLLLNDEWSIYDGLAITTLARAAFDEMRTAPHLPAAVIAADMALSTTHGQPRTSMTNLARIVNSHHKIRGIVQARKALVLASTRAASPWETRARMIATREARIPGWLVNAPVFDRNGALLGIADLLQPEAGLVIESDGSQHHEALQHAADNVREERFERCGLVVVRISAVDYRDQWTLVRRIREAHRDALATKHQTWTIEYPPWWGEWAGAQRWL